MFCEERVKSVSGLMSKNPSLLPICAFKSRDDFFCVVPSRAVQSALRMVPDNVTLEEVLENDIYDVGNMSP